MSKDSFMFMQGVSQGRQEIIDKAEVLIAKAESNLKGDLDDFDTAFNTVSINVLKQLLGKSHEE